MILMGIDQVINTSSAGATAPPPLTAALANSQAAAVAQPPQPLPPNSFLARHGTHRFEDPDQGGRGYLPQVNEWARGAIEWRCERAGGFEHMPVWEAFPIWRDEPLQQFNAQGPTKQAAKEASARLMAQSGHC